MTDNQTDWQWYVGQDEENYHILAPSRDEAVKIAKSCGGAYIIEARKTPLWLSTCAPHAELILEHAEEKENDSDGDYVIFDISEEHFDDLQASISAALVAWQERNKLTFMPWRFTETRHGEWIDGPLTGVKEP